MWLRHASDFGRFAQRRPRRALAGIPVDILPVMETHLRHLLDELKSTLGRLGPDDRHRADIERLAKTVERRLEEPHEDDHSFGEHLQDASRRFEAEHPRLGNAIQTVISGLGSAGI